MASFFLICVIISILTIYAGVLKLSFTDKPNMEVCVLGDRLLPSTPTWSPKNQGESCTKDNYQDMFCSSGNSSKCNSYYNGNNIQGYPVLVAKSQASDTRYADYNFGSKMQNEKIIIKVDANQNISTTNTADVKIRGLSPN